MADFLADFVELPQFAKLMKRHPRTIQRWIDEPNGGVTERSVDHDVEVVELARARSPLRNGSFGNRHEGDCAIQCGRSTEVCVD